jgi:uncharacterized protein involved in response to NO
MPAADRPPPHWRWQWLLAAPHRLGFFAGALMFAASGLWWAVVQVGGVAGLAPAWAVPPGVAHGLWMGHGFMPLFFAGFLFTAGPKWLALPPVAARAILWPVLVMVAGWLLFMAGLHASARLASLGVVLAAVGWGGLTLRFARLVVQSPASDKVHATVVLAGCCVGWMVLAAAAIGLGSGAWAHVRAATQFGLWGGVALVFVAVVHRMVPFFSASALPALDAWRPMWLLWVLAGGVVAQAPLAALELFGAAWPASVRAVQAGGELVLASLLLWLAVRWGLVQSLRIRLLAMLHLGFVWLGLAFLLQAASHTLQAAGAPGLGAAPLHALTAGFLGSTLLAMATRVSAGHSGRALAADNIAWGLFWGLQVAVVARVFAALWPAAAGWAIPVAAAVWAVVALAWALRYGRWYGCARVDGRPG